MVMQAEILTPSFSIIVIKYFSTTNKSDGL